MGPLKTPQQDKELVSAALTDINFDVVSKENATRVEIKYEVDSLAKKLEDAGDGAIGLLYYSGHGAAHEKINYLIPVDAKEPQNITFWYDAVPIDEIVRTLTSEAPNASIFIVFDACRSELHLPTKSLGAKGFNSNSITERRGAWLVTLQQVFRVPDLFGESGVERAALLKVCFFELGVRLEWQTYAGARSLLVEMKKKGERDPGGKGRNGSRPATQSKDLGISKTQSSRWQKLAEMTDEESEDKINRGRGYAH